MPLLVVGVGLLIVVNLLISVWTHSLPYYQKLEKIRNSHDPNLLFVGNSLLDGRVDEKAIASVAHDHGVSYVVLNSALGASEPPEQRLLFQYAVAKHSGIRTLVVGVFDFQLTKPDHASVSDLTGNRMIGIDRRFSASQVAAVYNFGMPERAELAILRALPMAANRANTWKYVELLRRSMSSLGMPSAATNSMGRVADFAALEARSPQAFDAKAQEFLNHPDHFNSSYESVFTQARKAGMNVVIVIMPMTPSHEEAFYSRPSWSQYMQSLTALANQRDIRVIDASEWFCTQRYFVDHLHMTSEAAHEFSVRLGNELSQAGSK